MRIIAGIWKGRIVAPPAAGGVRPTTDRLRETIFSILGHHLDLTGARVADLCAGTGALGFEALSRGAAHCIFVERQQKMAGEITRTATALGASEEQRRIVCGDALRFAAAYPAAEPAADVVFFDPPYAELLCNKLVGTLQRGNLLRRGGILVAEHDAKEAILLPTGWKREAQRGVGATVVDILRAAEE